MSLALGLWLAEPATLDDSAGMSMFPKLGMNDVGKSNELAAATLWELGLLSSLGFTRALIASACAPIALVLPTSSSGPLVHVPRKLGVYPLKRVLSL